MIRVVLASIILSLCIGSVYAWSIFILPIQELTNLSLPLIQSIFCLTIFSLGATASLGGKLINRMKPYKAAIIGSILFMLGMTLTSLALIYNPYFIGLTYGVLLGMGAGIIYLIPVPLLLQEFPNNKALGSSISILAFGFGAAAFIPLTKLFTSLLDVFVYMGLGYGILMIIASFLLKDKDYVKIDKKNSNFFTRDQAIRTKEFYYIFVMIFINIFVGISLISIAAPLGKELLIDTALLVSMIGIFNGLGRPLFAALADRIGYVNVYKVLFSGQLFSIALCMLNAGMQSVGTLVALCVVAACYGAGFACLPSLCAYVYGEGQVQQIFGTCLFAWGLAGLIAPLSISIICTYLGSYFTALILISALYFIGLYCATKIKPLV